jgi:hypothetical protein
MALIENFTRIDTRTTFVVRQFAQQYGCSHEVALKFLLKVGKYPQGISEDDEAYALIREIMEHGPGRRLVWLLEGLAQLGRHHSLVCLWQVGGRCQVAPSTRWMAALRPSGFLDHRDKRLLDSTPRLEEAGE